MASILNVDTINNAAGTSAISIDSSGNVAIPGHVVQVVQARSGGSAVQTTSTSFVDSGMSVSITPKFATSKIFITASFTATSTSSTSNGGTKCTFYRNGTTNILDDGSGGYLGYLEFNSNSSSYNHSISQMSYLDSPATTSATSYQIWFSLVSGGTASIQRDWGGVTMIAMEIAG